METLFDDGEGNTLWCVREYDDSPVSLFTSLDLLVEPPFTKYGKVMKQRRCVGFFSNSSEGYEYSGQVIPSQPFDPSPSHQTMYLLMQMINVEYGLDNNGVLVNMYRTGKDYVSPHGDSEKGLSHGTVASIAYGAVRNFDLYLDDKKILSVPHEHGMLLCMQGASFQRKYKHGIAADKTQGVRVSLTMRSHK